MSKVMYKGQSVTGAPDESAFTTSDTSATPASTDSIDLLSSSDSGATRWSKVSKNLKNTRFLVNKYGSADISEIGDGTVTGAIAYLSENGGGGSTQVKLAEVSGASVTTDLNTASITWTDPSDVEISGVKFAEWAGTKIVRKVGSAPSSYKDGTLVLDSTTKNQHASSALTDSNLVYGTTYYYGFFPYTKTGLYSDGSSISVTPSKGTAAVPTQSGSLTYDGSAQSPTWNYESAKMTKSETAQTDAGTNYETTFTLGSDYAWADGDTNQTKTITWSIARKPVSVPTQTNSLTYQSGVTQTPTWSHSEGYTLSGTTSSENAGTFTPTATLDSNYCWTGGSTSDETLSWSIAKATSAITVSPSSVTLNTNNKTATVTVGNILGRTITVETSNDSVATGSYSSGTLTVSHVNQNSGSATITVKAAASTNYNASNVTVSVTAAFIDTVLNNNDWATIQSVAQAGNGSSYWNVGDRKEVTLNGTVRARTLSNYKWYAYILGFNHNQAKEGTAIHFQFGFNALSGGVHTAMTDWTSTNAYGDYGDKVLFNMNKASSGTNSGGWNSCTMRSTTIPEFIQCLPAALQSALKAITKYTDNTGNSSNVAGNVTTTSDKVFLLAEYEVHGARSYANQYEYTDSKQAQYAYYSAGNSKVMYNDQVTGTAVYWWCRSAYCNDSTYFCNVNYYGDATAGNAYGSRGFAPGFAVG